MLTLVAAVVLATSAGGAPRDPLRLVLQRADVPAGAVYGATHEDFTGFGKALRASGIEAKVAGYFAEKGALQISGAVLATPSVAKAKRAFGIIRKKPLEPGLKPIAVPSYGDQQFAMYDSPDRLGVTAIHVLVRKNAVVWLLAVQLERTSKAALLSQLKKYAVKQKARVGSG